MFINLAIVFLCLAIILTFMLAYFAWSAKKTLLSDQITWSAKEIPFKRKKKIGSKRLHKNKRSSLLEEIDSQSQEFLDSQNEDTE
tara:strand:- start:132 stop:386 length:255 start_codon:yes stop_codon:yes gene_type:complete